MLHDNPWFYPKFTILIEDLQLYFSDPNPNEKCYLLGYNSKTMLRDQISISPMT